MVDKNKIKAQFTSDVDSYGRPRKLMTKVNALISEIVRLETLLEIQTGIVRPKRPGKPCCGYCEGKK